MERQERVKERYVKGKNKKTMIGNWGRVSSLLKFYNFKVITQRNKSCCQLYYYNGLMYKPKLILIFEPIVCG